jgi:hypothetical protein
MGGRSTPRHGHFNPRKDTQHPLYRRLGGNQGWSGWMQKISPTMGFDPRTVQPTASIYTDCTITAHPKKAFFLQNSVLFRERQWDTLQLQVCMFPVRCSGSPHELVCQVQGEPHWWQQDTTEVNACHLPSSKCLLSGSWVCFHWSHCCSSGDNLVTVTARSVAPVTAAATI